MLGRALLAVLLVPTIAGSDIALAAKPVKPPPPGGTTTPELAFVRISGGSRRFYELKMSNEDGTGASTIYSSRAVGSMIADLGPRADRTLLLIQGGKLSLMKYDITATGPKMTSLEQIIDMNHVGAATAAISATGTDVAFIKNGERTLWAYNLASKSLRKLAEGADYLGGIDFSPDGQTIYYVEQVGAELFELKSVPLAGGGGSSMGVQGYYSELAVDPNGDILLVDISDWPQSRIYRYTPGGGSPEYVTDGSGPSVKCDSSSIIVQRNNSDGSVSLVRRDIPSGTEHLFSSKELYRPDYMPTC